MESRCFFTFDALEFLVAPPRREAGFIFEALLVGAVVGRFRRRDGGVAEVRVAEGEAVDLLGAPSGSQFFHVLFPNFIMSIRLDNGRRFDDGLRFDDDDGVRFNGFDALGRDDDGLAP